MNVKAFNFSHQSVWDIISFAETSSNNHILNTLLIKLSEFIFGAHEVAHRLPNLLAHLVFLVFSILITRYIKNTLPALCLFCLLNLQPHLFDFFSLARGYGLAAAFFTGALYYLLCYNKESNSRLATLCILFASLAVLSNFSNLIFFITFCGMLVFSFQLQHRQLERISYRKALLQHIRYPAMVLVILTVIIFEPVRKLKAFGGLYYGGDKSFWEDTVNSLITGFAYGTSYENLLITTLNFFIAGILLVALIWFAIRIKKKDSTLARSNFLLFFATLLLAAFIVIVQFQVLDVKFIISRAAMQFILLFAVFVGFFLDAFQSTSRLAAGFVISVSLIIITVSVLHFDNTLNLDYTYEWRFDGDTPQVIADIQKDAIASGATKKQIALACSWPPLASLNYYRIIHKQDWLLPVEVDTIKKRFDYYFLMTWMQPYNLDTLQVVKQYTLSGGILVKPK